MTQSRLRAGLDRPYLIAVTRLLSAFLSLASAFVLARALGPEGRGQIATAIAVTTLLPIVLGIGIPLVVRRETARAGSPDQVVRTARRFALLVTGPAIAIGFICSTTFLGSLDSGAQLAFIISASTAPASVLWICDANVLFAQGRSAAFALTDLLPTGVNVALIVVGAMVSDLTVTYAIVVNWVASIATLILTSWLVRVPLRGDARSLRSTLEEGIRYSGSQIAEMASHRLDQVLALPVVGAFQAGLYSVAATVALLPLALGQALGASSYRSFARARDEVDASVRSTVVLRVAFVTACVAVAPMAAVSPWLVPFALGRAFEDAVVPVLLSLLGSLALVVSYVASVALAARGRGWIMTVAQVIGLVAGISALILLAPPLGAVGLSLASTIGYWACAFVCVGAIRPTLRELAPRPSDLRRSVQLLFSRVDDSGSPDLS